MKFLIPAIAAISLSGAALAQQDGSDEGGPFTVESADGSIVQPSSDYTFDLDDEGSGDGTIYQDYEDAAPGEAAGLDVIFDL